MTLQLQPLVGNPKPEPPSPLTRFDLRFLAHYLDSCPAARRPQVCYWTFQPCVVYRGQRCGVLENRLQCDMHRRPKRTKAAIKAYLAMHPEAALGFQCYRHRKRLARKGGAP